jgi:hypothetical protein
VGAVAWHEGGGEVSNDRLSKCLSIDNLFFSVLLISHLNLKQECLNNVI